MDGGGERVVELGRGVDEGLAADLGAGRRTGYNEPVTLLNAACTGATVL